MRANHVIVTRRQRWTCIVWMVLGLCVMLHARNLVPDASFEGPLPSWLPENQAAYYLDKRQSPTAAEGETVMLIKAWHSGNARIVSPHIHLKPQAVSMTCQVRHRGEPEQLTIELVVLDSSDRVIGTSGAWQADGTNSWYTLSKEGIQAGDALTGLLEGLDGEAEDSGMLELRLALLIRGPMRGHELEIDQLGLFPGEAIEPVTDNAVTRLFSVSDLQTEQGWELRERDAVYPGDPSTPELESAPNALARAQVMLPESGRYRLWVRLRTSQRTASEKNLRLSIGSHAATPTVHYGKKDEGGWFWGGIEATAEAGMVSIAVQAIKPGVRITHLLVTGNPDYLPDDNDLFLTPAYMRYTNESADQAPYLLWVYVKTHDIKSPHNHLGMLGMSGTNGFFPPKDESLFIRPGDTTPWLRLSDVLYADRWTYLNTLQLTATRKTRLGGHVDGRIKGRLEFAVGPDRRIIKTVQVDQASPSLSMTLPHDLGNHPDQIMAPMDYVREKQDVIETLPDRTGDNAKHLKIIVANPGFGAGRTLVQSELDIVKRLGANTIRRAPTSDEAIDYYRQQGMQTSFTLDVHTVWEMIQETSMYHPDLAAIESYFAQTAESYAATRDHIDRVILADEPGGLSYKAMMTSPKCQDALQVYLQEHGIRDQLAGQLNELLGKDPAFQPYDPTEHPERKLKEPKLFYHMELFRLNGMAHLVQAFTEIKNRHFPESARTLVNHVPYHSAYGSWVKRGVDPYFVHGPNGLQLPWTEDWMAYGAGPQEMSPLYALLRSAGREHGDTIGGYVVVKDGSPQLVRKKLYTAVAGGMHEIDLYNYSPPYAGWLNSWSEQFEKYPVIQQTLEEFGAIDAALHETTRQPTDIAILYNRTQAIWANPGYTSYYDIDLVHWALAHAGYDADYLSEEDVEAGLLDRYKVLYLGGEHLKQSCAEAIAEWVQRGGTLCGQTGAALRNEYHEPWAGLEPLFGVTVTDPRDTGVRMPRLKMKDMEARGHFTSETPPASFPNYSYTEALEPTTASVFLKDADGKPKGTLNKVGQGQAIRIAGAPATAYLVQAVKDEDYDVKSFLPKAFDPALRDLIAWPATLAGARRVAETDEPIMEIVRYDKPGTTVLILIDHDNTPKQEIQLRIPDAGSFKTARTATGAPVTLSPDGDAAILHLPLDMCEAIVLEP